MHCQLTGQKQQINVMPILMIYYNILLTIKNKEKEFIKQTLIKIEDSLHLGFVCPLFHL